MVSWKDYIKKQFLNRHIRFLSDCCITLDITGIVKDVEWHGGEVIFCIETNSGKIAKIGSNTENLKLEFLK